MTYADDFNLRDKDLCKINDIADAVDGLLVDYAVDTSVASQTIATTAWTDITGMSHTVTVAAGEIVELNFTSLAKVVTAADAVEWRLARDVTVLDPSSYALTAITANGMNAIAATTIDEPGAGSFTYIAQARNGTGARNVFIGARCFTVKVIQNA